MKYKSHLQLFVTPWIAPSQAPLNTEFSRQEYWCGLPCPPPGDPPNPGIELVSPSLAHRFFTTVLLGKDKQYITVMGHHRKRMGIEIRELIQERRKCQPAFMDIM